MGSALHLGEKGLYEDDDDAAYPEPYPCEPEQPATGPISKTLHLRKISNGSPSTNSGTENVNTGSAHMPTGGVLPPIPSRDWS